MGYIRAEDVLPPDLLAMVQQYVDGEMVYVPKKNTKRNNWGAVSGTKAYYTNRNALICREYDNGFCVRELAEKYFLSEKSIQRIIRNRAPSCFKKTGKKRENHEP